MKKISLLIFVLFCYINLFSYESKRLMFKQIDNESSLSQNGVVSIFQDKKGCMWFGTRYGLNKYDGFNIENFYSNGAKDQLAGNSILSMLEDDSDNIWILTDEGITIYNHIQKRFYNLRYYINESILTGTIFSINYFNKKIIICSSSGIWEITIPENLITEDIL